MASPRFMIYGAYGYTGKLVAQEALRRGHKPVLAGRSADKLLPLAAELNLEAIAVDLDDAAGLQRALSGIDLVFHAAGPFIRTSDAMIRACLHAGAHYLDVTGEIPVFANTFSYDAAAKEKRVALISGVGFDVVPTDCLAAHVAKQVPAATELEIGISALAVVSAGTAKSSIAIGLQGGLVRRAGKLVPMPLGKGSRTLQFVSRKQAALPIPWGDLETAYHTTGIPNITTYIAVPRASALAGASTWPLMAAAMPAVRGLLGRPHVLQALERRLDRVQGPDEQQRSAGSCEVWACARDASGKQAEAWLRTCEGYKFTALAGMRAVEAVFAKQPIGAVTPALAFGADFVLDVEGTQRFDRLPA